MNTYSYQLFSTTKHLILAINNEQIINNEINAFWFIKEKQILVLRKNFFMVDKQKINPSIVLYKR